MDYERIDFMEKPVKVVVVGMGARAMIYAKESLKHPKRFKVVGVVDINEDRIRDAQEVFYIPDNNCFHSVEELLSVPKFADAVINGTMDALHVETTIPLLKRGYDVLLEKPFAINQEEADRLLQCVNETGRTVMVCHVLRYAPFYKEIKKVLRKGMIGKIINIQMNEQVSYFHESVSYVRGKYASPIMCGSGMLLSKCSHDLDIMAWLMNGNLPYAVSSVGSVIQFIPEMAPERAGTHCMVNCPVERECIYSAKRLYIENPQRWSNNIWHDIGKENPTDKEKEQLLKDIYNSFGRCVYRCNLEIVDHQSVLIQFADGATGTFSMNGGASASGRNIHITGTKGELVGRFEEERFTVHVIAPEEKGGRVSMVVDVSETQKGNAHGNGDQAIVEDFIAVLRGKQPSDCCTTLNDSMVGHKIVFLAEASRKAGGELLKYKKERAYLCDKV